MVRSLALEIAVQDAAGVRVAREIGAARVELAQGLALGGLTPSATTIELALEASGADGPEIHVLVRPRSGGFFYDDGELAVIEGDIRHAVARGVHGVVIGVQNAAGTLDVDALARLRDAAGDASVTLHRVIDVTSDPLAALDIVRELGFARVLTSGGASSAIDGVDTLRALVSRAEGAVQIMAGSGVSAANVVEIADTGVDAVHFSAKRIINEQGGVRMGSASDGVGGYEVTDLAEAQAIRAALGL